LIKLQAEEKIDLEWNGLLKYSKLLRVKKIIKLKLQLLLTLKDLKEHVYGKKCNNVTYRCPKKIRYVKLPV
jgi:hypothetical protein